MPTAAAPPHTSPAATWKALAHLLAARPTIRLWNARTDKFDRTANLTSRLPRQPAAVPLYQHGRTCLLALDFDTKRHSRRSRRRRLRPCAQLDHRGRRPRRYRPIHQRRAPHPGPLGSRHQRHPGRNQPTHAAAGVSAAQPGQNPHDQPRHRLHHHPRLPVPPRRIPHPRRPDPGGRGGPHHPFTPRPAPPPEHPAGRAARPTSGHRQRRHRPPHRDRTRRPPGPPLHPHHTTARPHHHLRHHRPAPGQRHLEKPLRSPPIRPGPRRAARTQPGHHHRPDGPRTPLARRISRRLHPLPPQRRQSPRTRLRQSPDLGKRQRHTFPT